MWSEDWRLGGGNTYRMMMSSIPERSHINPVFFFFFFFFLLSISEAERTTHHDRQNVVQVKCVVQRLEVWFRDHRPTFSSVARKTAHESYLLTWACFKEKENQKQTCRRAWTLTQWLEPDRKIRRWWSPKGETFVSTTVFFLVLIIKARLSMDLPVLNRL